MTSLLPNKPFNHCSRKPSIPVNITDENHDAKKTQAKRGKSKPLGGNSHLPTQNTSTNLDLLAGKKEACEVPKKESVRSKLSAIIKPAAFAPVIDDSAMDVDGVANDVDMNISLEDIDEYDRDDPLFCTEYVEEILQHLRAREKSDRVNPNYMKIQIDLLPEYRFVLIEWMSEVYIKYCLTSETLFLAIQLVDQFLSIKPVSRVKLQLIGLTALLIACKFEELFSPEVKDFIYLCDNAYTREEVLRMERVMLTILGYNLALANPLYFLRRFSRAARSDAMTHTLSKYLSELTVSSYEMLKFLPSEVAAASVYIARKMRNVDSRWNSNLRHYTGYEEADILPCVRALNALLHNEHARQAEYVFPITRKYSSRKLFAVATIPPVEI